MPNDLERQISDARQTIERREAVEARLAEAREDRTSAEYRLEALTTYVEQAEAVVQDLESSSIGTLLSTLTGSRERKVAAKQMELQSLQEKQQETIDQLNVLKSEVASLETELTNIANVAETYEALCRQRQSEVLAGGGASAAKLKELTADADRLSEIERQCKSAIESGETVVERIRAMAGAVGRAKNKMIMPSALGALGQVTLGAIAAKGADPAVKRVSEGLEQFHEKLQAIDCSANTDLDMEITRVTTDVEQSCVEISGTSAARLAWGGGMEAVIQELVFNVLGLVKGKLDRVEQALKENRKQQQRLLEAP